MAMRPPGAFDRQNGEYGEHGGKIWETGFPVTGRNEPGESASWVEIEFPCAIVLDEYDIQSRNDGHENLMPWKLSVHGTNDGINLVPLDSWEGITWQNHGEWKNFDSDETMGAFLRFRFTIHKVQNKNAAPASLGDIQLKASSWNALQWIPPLDIGIGSTWQKYPAPRFEMYKEYTGSFCPGTYRIVSDKDWHLNNAANLFERSEMPLSGAFDYANDPVADDDADQTEHSNYKAKDKIWTPQNPGAVDQEPYIVLELYLPCDIKVWGYGIQARAEAPLEGPSKGELYSGNHSHWTGLHGYSYGQSATPRNAYENSDNNRVLDFSHVTYRGGGFGSILRFVFRRNSESQATRFLGYLSLKNLRVLAFDYKGLIRHQRQRFREGDSGKQLMDELDQSGNFQSPKGPLEGRSICMCYYQQRKEAFPDSTPCQRASDFSEPLAEIDSQGDEGPFPPLYLAQDRPTGWINGGHEWWQYLQEYIDTRVYRNTPFCFYGKTLTATGLLRVTPLSFRIEDEDAGWMKYGRGALALSRGECGDLSTGQMVRIHTQAIHERITAGSTTTVDNVRYCRRAEGSVNVTDDVVKNTWERIGDESIVSTVCEQASFYAHFQGTGVGKLCWCGDAACESRDVDISLFKTYIQDVNLGDLQIKSDDKIRFYPWNPRLANSERTNWLASQTCTDKGLALCTLDELGAGNRLGGPWNPTASSQLDQPSSGCDGTNLCTLPSAPTWLEKYAGVYFLDEGGGQQYHSNHVWHCKSKGLKLCSYEEICGRSKLWTTDGTNYRDRKGGTIWRRKRTIAAIEGGKWVVLEGEWDAHEDCKQKPLSEISYWSDIRHYCCPIPAVALPEDVVEASSNRKELNVERLTIHRAGHYKVCWCADQTDEERCSPMMDGTFARGYESLLGSGDASDPDSARDHYVDIYVAGPHVSEKPTLAVQTLVENAAGETLQKRTFPLTVNLTSAKPVVEERGLGVLTNQTDFVFFTLSDNDCFNISQGLASTPTHYYSSKDYLSMDTPKTTEGTPLDLFDAADNVTGVDARLTYSPDAYFPYPKQIQMCWCFDGTDKIDCSVTVGDTLIRGLPTMNVHRHGGTAGHATPWLMSQKENFPSIDPNPPRYWSKLKTPEDSSSPNPDSRRLEGSTEVEVKSRLGMAEELSTEPPDDSIGHERSPDDETVTEKDSEDAEDWEEIRGGSEYGGENEAAEGGAMRRRLSSHIRETPEQFLGYVYEKWWYQNGVWRVWIYLQEKEGGWDASGSGTPSAHTAPFHRSDRVAVFADPHTCGQNETSWPFLDPYRNHTAGDDVVAHTRTSTASTGTGVFKESKDTIVCFCPGTLYPCEKAQDFAFYLGKLGISGPQYRVIFSRPHQPLAVHMHFNVREEEVVNKAYFWPGNTVQFRHVDLGEDCNSNDLDWEWSSGKRLHSLLYCDPERCTPSGCVNPMVDTCTPRTTADFTDTFKQGTEETELNQQLINVPFVLWGRIYRDIKVTKPLAVCYRNTEAGTTYPTWQYHSKARVADVLIRGPIWEGPSTAGVPRDLTFPDGLPTTFSPFRVRLYGTGFLPTSHIIFIPDTDNCGQLVSQLDTIGVPSVQEADRIEAATGYRPEEVLTFKPMYVRDPGRFKICYWDGDEVALDYKKVYRVSNAREVDPYNPSSLNNPNYCPPLNIAARSSTEEKTYVSFEECKYDQTALWNVEVSGPYNPQAETFKRAAKGAFEMVIRGHHLPASGSIILLDKLRGRGCGKDFMPDIVEIIKMDADSDYDGLLKPDRTELTFSFSVAEETTLRISWSPVLSKIGDQIVMTDYNLEIGELEILSTRQYGAEDLGLQSRSGDMPVRLGAACTLDVGNVLLLQVGRAGGGVQGARVRLLRKRGSSQSTFCPVDNSLFGENAAVDCGLEDLEPALFPSRDHKGRDAYMFQRPDGNQLTYAPMLPDTPNRPREYYDQWQILGRQIDEFRACAKGTPTTDETEGYYKLTGNEGTFYIASNKQVHETDLLASPDDGSGSELKSSQIFNDYSITGMALSETYIFISGPHSVRVLDRGTEDLRLRFTLPEPPADATPSRDRRLIGFSYPHGVAISERLSDEESARVLAHFKSSSFGTITHVLYVADTGNHRIVQLGVSPDGRLGFLESYGDGYLQPRTDDTGYQYPCAVSYWAGHILIGEFNSPRVVLLDVRDKRRAVWVREQKLRRNTASRGFFLFPTKGFAAETGGTDTQDGSGGTTGRRLSILDKLSLPNTLTGKKTAAEGEPVLSDPTHRDTIGFSYHPKDLSRLEEAEKDALESEELQLDGEEAESRRRRRLQLSLYPYVSYVCPRQGANSELQTFHMSYASADAFAFVVHELRGYSLDYSIAAFAMSALVGVPALTWPTLPAHLPLGEAHGQSFSPATHFSKQEYFTIWPPLPPNMQLDHCTGAISGTPVNATPYTEYNVTISNAVGRFNNTIRLGTSCRDGLHSIDQFNCTYCPKGTYRESLPEGDYKYDGRQMYECLACPANTTTMIVANKTVEGELLGNLTEGHWAHGVFAKMINGKMFLEIGGVSIHDCGCVAVGSFCPGVVRLPPPMNVTGAQEIIVKDLKIPCPNGLTTSAPQAFLRSKCACPEGMGFLHPRSYPFERVRMDVAALTEKDVFLRRWWMDAFFNPAKSDWNLCLPCPPGTFKDFVGNSPCIPCPRRATWLPSEKPPLLTLMKDPSTVSESEQAIKVLDRLAIEKDPSRSDVTERKLHGVVPTAVSACSCFPGDYWRDPLVPHVTGRRRRMLSDGKNGEDLGEEGRAEWDAEAEAIEKARFLAHVKSLGLLGEKTDGGEEEEGRAASKRFLQAASTAPEEEKSGTDKTTPLTFESRIPKEDWDHIRFAPETALKEFPTEALPSDYMYSCISCADFGYDPIRFPVFPLPPSAIQLALPGGNSTAGQRVTFSECKARCAEIEENSNSTGVHCKSLVFEADRFILPHDLLPPPLKNPEDFISEIDLNPDLQDPVGDDVTSTLPGDETPVSGVNQSHWHYDEHQAGLCTFYAEHGIEDARMKGALRANQSALSTKNLTALQSDPLALDRASLCLRAVCIRQMDEGGLADPNICTPCPNNHFCAGGRDSRSAKHISLTPCHNHSDTSVSERPFASVLSCQCEDAREFNSVSLDQGAGELCTKCSSGSFKTDRSNS
eukprot:Cvel_14537.t1-p1 / transcript=Cvel_14537.t1 / gene=Cvel_14537 / organism=Chromera_velia_CCMP2878 / gene_product=hypothetical protein / transcript_product=hypothetical protein / location=Cvel_scaffold1038:146-31976(-) / protein_length=3142 / sequence_SO=supercontig / SO=protein_coding / is_pseudo=false